MFPSPFRWLITLACQVNRTFSRTMFVFRQSSLDRVDSGARSPKLAREFSVAMNRFKLNATWCVKPVFAVKNKKSQSLAVFISRLPGSAASRHFPCGKRIFVTFQHCRETILSRTLVEPRGSRDLTQLKPSKTCAGRAILAGQLEPRSIYESAFLRISPVLAVCSKNRPGLQPASGRCRWVCRAADAIPGTLTTHSILGIPVGRRETCRTVWERTGNSRGVGLSVKNPS